jgi:Arc/MetJ-type ribon-helix-helix transcriptional regulator
MAEDGTPFDGTSVGVELSETLRQEIEECWNSLGYTSRSAFLRDVIADAVAHPAFDRRDLRAMLAAEVDIQAGRTHSSAEIAAEVGTDRPAVGDNEWDWVVTDTARADLDRCDEYARERIVTRLDGIVSGEWRNPTEDLQNLVEAPHDKLLIGPFRLGCRVDHDAGLLYVLRIRIPGA